MLTNDGEVAERLMHPRFGFERVYHARVEGAVPVALLNKLEQGLRLSDGVVKATGSILRNDEASTWVEIRIHEGRNRVVRRMFEKLGHPVMKLKRIVYGPFKLGRLQVGQVRVLTRKEYEEARVKVLRTKESGGAEDSNRSDNRSDNRSVNRSGGRSVKGLPGRAGVRSGRGAGGRSGSGRSARGAKRRPR